MEPLFILDPRDNETAARAAAALLAIPSLLEELSSLRLLQLQWQRQQLLRPRQKKWFSGEQKLLQLLVLCRLDVLQLQHESIADYVADAQVATEYLRTNGGASNNKRRQRCIVYSADRAASWAALIKVRFYVCCFSSCCCYCVAGFCCCVCCYWWYCFAANSMETQ